MATRKKPRVARREPDPVLADRESLHRHLIFMLGTQLTGTPTAAEDDEVVDDESAVDAEV